MHINKVVVAYFSPTHGTKTYVEAIAQKLSANFKIIDLTKPVNRKKTYHFKQDDLVIIGAPVYMGRIPMIEGGIFDCLYGQQTPVILNAVYGNREFEDALLEEKDILEKHGFITIAGATWIAPHTFSDKIANTRPDKKDYLIIEQFTKKIQELLKCQQSFEQSISIPGHHPYREALPPLYCPEPKDNCVKCKKCASVCPVGIISKQDAYIKEPNLCISCLACVKNCPLNARHVVSEKYQITQKRLESMLVDRRQEPELFF